MSTQQMNTKPRVLVVDDDADLRMLAGLHLGDAFDVLEASSGQECIDLALEHLPDVILLDMMMPGMSGSEVLDALSAVATTRDIPVIFLSAVVEADERVQALENGATDYITKPADWRELSARVGSAARTRARHEEIRMGSGLEPVTGLPYRAQFESRLREEVSRSTRSNSPLALLLIAVDDLETAKLRFGAEGADQVMKGVSELINSSLRTADSLYRYAEAELAAILPDTDVATAYLAAERLRDAVNSLPAKERPSSLSVGVAEFMSGHDSADLMAKAEVALFRARESGGNLSWRADDPRKRGINTVSLAEELTDREWDILTNLVQRRTEQEIARRLGISAGTVRSHKARIRRKLHVAPEVRLSEFVKTNLPMLAERLAVQAESRSGATE